MAVSALAQSPFKRYKEADVLASTATDKITVSVSFAPSLHLVGMGVIPDSAFLVNNTGQAALSVDLSQAPGFFAIHDGQPAAPPVVEIAWIPDGSTLTAPGSLAPSDWPARSLPSMGSALPFSSISQGHIGALVFNPARR
jgi:hypothetical protein